MREEAELAERVRLLKAALEEISCQLGSLTLNFSQLSAASSYALTQGSSFYAAGMTLASSPSEQLILNNAPDFISPFFPGPPTPNIAGGAGWLTSIILSYIGCDIK